ncbi:MAG: extracellular solute-binding protein [Anaerolineae bacterium]
MSPQKISRREFARLAALTGGAAALAACSPRTVTAPTSAPAAGADTTPAAAAAAGFKGTIEFWDWDHEPRTLLLDQLAAEFNEAHPGVIVKPNQIGWTEIETKILTVTTGGTGPAFSNIHYFWRYDLQRAGVLSPYPEDMFDYADLISTPYNRDPETGHIYTSTFNFYADQLYYNRELLEAEGIKEEDIPRDWDTFLAMAKQLTKTDASGKITQAGFSMNDYWGREWFWMDLVYQLGGWLFNEGGTEAIWNSEEGVRALKFLQDLYTVHKVDDPEFLGQGDAFGNGKAAFYINMGYTAAGINTSFPQMEGKWATAIEPTFTGTALPSYGLQVPEEGFCVFNKFPSEQQAMCFEFIKYILASDERRLQWAEIMGGPPDNKSLLDNPQMTGNNIISTQAETLPYRVNYGERPLEAEKLWRAMFDEAILEEGDPKEILDKATDQMNAAFKESGKKRYIVERNYQPPSA